MPQSGTGELAHQLDKLALNFTHSATKPETNALSEAGTQGLVRLSVILQRIHNRLHIEGYVIKDGRVVCKPPLKEAIKVYTERKKRTE